MTGLLVALGGSDGGSISTDGIKWQGRIAKAEGMAAGVTAQALAYSPSLNLFVAGAYADSDLSPRIYTSPDGKTWTGRTIPTWGAAEYITDAIWDATNALFIVVGNRANSILTSPDGVTWTNRAAGNAGRLLGLGIDGAGKIVATGTNEYLTSTSGTSWTLCTAPRATAARAVVWAASLGLWLMAHDVGSASSIYTSTTAATGSWTERTTSFTTLVASLAWNGTTAVATANSGELETSTNGTSWTVRTSNLGGGNISKVLWAASLNLFVAIAQTAGVNVGIATSPDGTTWTAQIPGFRPGASGWALGWGSGIAAPYSTEVYDEWVGSFTKQTAVGEQDITLPTGCPDLRNAAPGTVTVEVMTFGSEAASGTLDTHIVACIGAAAGPGNACSSAVSSQDAAGAGNSGRAMQAKLITLVSASASGTFATDRICDAEFVGFPSSTTMRINWINNDASDGFAGVVFMFKITIGLEDSQVVRWNEPATATTKSVTNVRFKPDLLHHCWIMSAATFPQSAASAVLGYGVVNKHGQQGSISIQSQDTADPTNTSRWQQVDACLLGVWSSETALGQAHHISMDTNGFTTFWSAVNGSSEVWTLCKKGVSSKIGALVSATGAAPLSQPWSSRHGFAPSGLMLFSQWLNGSNGVPPAHANFGVGFYDGANQRVVTGFDRDAQATSSVGCVWYSAAIAAQLNVAPLAVYQLGSITAWDADTFTVNWTVNDAPDREIVYCLTGPPGVDTFPQTVAV